MENALVLVCLWLAFNLVAVCWAVVFFYWLDRVPDDKP